MTYTVEALRHAVDGGAASTVVHAALLLLAYGIAGVSLTLGVTHRARRMTGADLHPELVV
jgi:putative membrane protein